MLHMGAVGERESLVKGAPKSTYGRKRVEVVIPMMARKVGKRPPSVITVGDSSGPDETNVADKDKGDSGDPSDLFFSDDELASSTHKQKAKSPQSSHPTKRKASLQIRLAMKKRKRLQIVLLLSSDLSSEERLPRTITARNSSRPDEVNVVDRHKVCGNATELFVSDDEQAPSTHKCKKKLQGSSHPMKQPASLLEMDTAQPSSPKVVKGSPQMRPVIKKPRLRSISPLSSELSSKEEVETHPSGDQLNVTSPRVSVEHQQSSGELHVKQYPVMTNIQTSLHKSLHAVKKINDYQVGHTRSPLGLKVRHQKIQIHSPHNRLPLAAPSQVTPPHILGGQPIAGDPSHKPTGNQLPVAPHPEPCYTEMMECDLAGGGQKGRGVPSQVPRHDELVHLQHTQESAQHDQQWSVQPLHMKQVAICEKTNPTADLPTQWSHPQSRWPASRLVAAEEGYIGGSSGDGEMATDSTAGECPGEPNHSQTHLPLPRYHYDMTMSRDQDQPMHLNSDRMYHGDDQFGYEGIPYPLSINSRWYDLSARGSDVCYGPYHPQYILPPPFAAHCYPGMHNANYANPSGGHELPAGPYQCTEVYGPKQPDAAAFPDT
ncbi:hypothetical protein EDC04DRAFT_2609982 [Pisolithus marmoratus]|nr:hypothetical protein EDC04DRAFT_2609982 [Pisolithus marmoratus]